MADEAVSKSARVESAEGAQVAGSGLGLYPPARGNYHRMSFSGTKRVTRFHRVTSWR